VLRWVVSPFGWLQQQVGTSRLLSTASKTLSFLPQPTNAPPHQPRTHTHTQKKNGPAVVLVQLMPKGMAFAPTHQEKVPYSATLEDIYGAQAQYYDLPWLSFRNAMWRMSELHK